MSKKIADDLSRLIGQAVHAHSAYIAGRTVEARNHLQYCRSRAVALVAAIADEVPEQEEIAS